MTVTHQDFAKGGTADGPRAALIVDDSAAQRRIFARQLAQWGYHTVEAGSGAEALDICADQRFDLILSDWMMPGMNGLDFCRAFRALDHDDYCYFILLTSKNDKGAVAEGLDVGADDFLSKPVAAPELRARIAAGERLLTMERELKARNDALRTTLDELRAIHDALDRDLMEARKLQKSLIRDRVRSYGASRLSLLLHSAGHVGGDVVGSFAIGAHRLGIYAIDVAGHGVAAALLGARIGALFAGGDQTRNIALAEDGAAPPEQVAARLNTLMLQEIDTEAYLTLAYADIDLRTGHVRMVQAGHPHPMIQRADGTVEFVGQGGLPVGLIADATFAGFDTVLHPGDRLFLYSDGITECTDGDGREFGADGLAALFARLATLRGMALLDALKWDLARWAGKDDFGDDISGAVLEFDGYAPAA